MDYIFCPSYESIFFALYLKVKKNKEIRIITSHEGIRKFCEFTKIKCFFFGLPDTGWRHFYRLWFLKKDIDCLLRAIDIKKEDSFFLFGSYMAYSGFYIAKEWSKKGRVFFKELGISYSKLKPHNSQKNLYLLWLKIYYRVLMRLAFGIKLTLYDIPGQDIVPGIDEKFLKKNKIQYLELRKTINQLATEAVSYKLFDIGRQENLFMYGYGKLVPLIKKDSLLSLYEKLRKLPFKIVIKLHPDLPNQESELKQVQQIFGNSEILPYYIPAELVFSSIKKNVLAVASGGLIAASQINHLKAISLLELVEWRDEKLKQYFKNYLREKSNNKIIFVNNFEELKKVMNRK